MAKILKKKTIHKTELPFKNVVFGYLFSYDLIYFEKITGSPLLALITISVTH